MRTFLFFLGVIFVTATSCDQIDYRNAKETPAPQDTTSAKRVLLYDFTGQTCGNCPTGHDQSKTLENLYPGRFFAMSIHCGFFAEPLRRPDSLFAQDYRTTVGNELDTRYGASNAGLPRGVINGLDTTKSGTAGWARFVANQFKKTSITQLELTLIESSASVSVNQLSAYAQPLTLTFYVLQDSVLSAQRDYRKPIGQQDLLVYYHRHLLRKSLSIPQFVASGFKGSKSATFNLPSLSTPKPWHKEVLAVLTDPTTGEVLQVDKAIGR